MVILAYVKPFQHRYTMEPPTVKNEGRVDELQYLMLLALITQPLEENKLYLPSIISYTEMF